MSHLMKNALVGEYPEVGIAPSKVVVSQGKLAGAGDGSLSFEEDGVVRFSWSEPFPEGNARPEDQAILEASRFQKTGEETA